MDPITGVIVAALSAGVAGKAGEMVLKNTYEALKTAIRKKYGKESKVAAAVLALENEPDSKPNREAWPAGSSKSMRQRTATC